MALDYSLVLVMHQMRSLCSKRSLGDFFMCLLEASFQRRESGVGAGQDPKSAQVNAITLSVFLLAKESG